MLDSADSHEISVQKLRSLAAHYRSQVNNTEEAKGLADFFDSVATLLQGWIRVIDESLMGCHIGVVKIDDSYEEARSKLNMLIDLHVNVAVDPAMNGGFKLTPVDEPGKA